MTDSLFNKLSVACFQIKTLLEHHSICLEFSGGFGMNLGKGIHLEHQMLKYTSRFLEKIAIVKLAGAII